MAAINLQDFPDSLRDAIKTAASLKGKTMKQFIIDLLRANKEVKQTEMYIQKEGN